MKLLVFLALLVALEETVAALDLKSHIQNEIFSSNRSNLTISACESDISKLFESLDGSIQSWGWKMLDATSKLQSGVESFSDDVGQFDECVKAENEDGKIIGKYCLGQLMYKHPDNEFSYEKSPRMEDTRDWTRLKTHQGFRQSILWSACLPSSCSAENFNSLYNKIFKSISKDISIVFTDNTCTTKNDNTDLSTGSIVTISFFIAFVCMMVVGTIYDLYCQKYEKEPVRFVLAFSTYTNSSKLFKMNSNGNQLDCLNGLRFFSLLWVIIGHTYFQGYQAPLINRIDVKEWADDLQSMLLVSSYLAVDTFLVVGGTLVSYGFRQAMKRSNKFNIFTYYLHRYIRLTPALGALMLAVAFLFPYLGNGPNWSRSKYLQNCCQENWWAALLYIQNYTAGSKLCLGHSWYLSVDMQLYIISPIILFSLRKYVKPTIAALMAIIVAIAIYSFFTAWDMHYTALLSNFNNDNGGYFADFYVKTHVRAGSWILGVIIGYTIFEIKEKKLNFRPHKVLNLAIWIICIVALLICVYIGHDSLRTPEFNEWGNSLHIALIRQLWVTGISWIMVSGIFGYGGPVNWFLSFPIYQIFNRFSYSMYLIHYVYVNWWFLSTKSTLYFNDMLMIMYFWGVVCFTCIISYFWVLAFECPFIILEKILLEFLARPKQKQTTP